ncbi:MAG TPA: type II toxin-antitoxin system VapC family toxin [Longimicrobium sp.]|nr:type II toxin-antitoxin system VapC family toxin [Longimicrobium sp.]
MANELFLDTSYALALSNLRDQHHAAAVELARRIRLERTRLITTHAVILEIGNAMAKARQRSAGLDLIEALQDDPAVEIVPLSEELFAEGVAFYRRHQDKEWGLTDCISFVVMHTRSLREALTADNHFRQAGFRAVLAES